MLRIILFLATNPEVILLVHIIMSLLGLDPSGAAGMNYGSLLVFASLFGFITIASGYVEVDSEAFGRRTGVGWYRGYPSAMAGSDDPCTCRSCRHWTT